MAEVKVVPVNQIKPTFDPSCIDLVSAPLGSRIVACSNEFFASASNLITPGPAIHKPGHFVETGAWYDGWETRRHNPAEYDWVVIRLGVAAGRIRGFEVDTAHFNGNHAPAVSIQAAFSLDNTDDEIKKPGYQGWTTLMGQTACGPSQRHAWDLGSFTDKAYTHVRILMYPDGGIARFRLYGAVQPVLPKAGVEFDLASAQMGGRVTSCSDQHFSRADNILLPGRGKDMGDGWETKRSRGDHVDWAVIRLGAVGAISSVMVDTLHFRGNFPREVAIYATLMENGEPAGRSDEPEVWTQIVAPQKTSADKEHIFGKDILKNVDGQVFSHVKMVMIPDGGIKRIRVFGQRSSKPAMAAQARL